MTTKDYVSLTYSLERTPLSGYPDQLAAHLKKIFGLKVEARMLEIGCGRGDFLKAFHRQGLKCFGVDREASAKSFSPELEIHVCDISKDRLPFEDESFDVVYHKSMIEHLYSPTHLMAETHRVLKKGGKCIILTPDWVSTMRVFYEDLTHCRPYDKTALRDAFTLSGFQNVSSKKFYQLPILWSLKPLVLVSKILSFFLNVQVARFLTEKTKIKFFRWSVELMVLGYGEK